MGRPDTGAILEQMDAAVGRLGPCNTPALRGVRRTLSQTLAPSEPAFVLAVADALVERGTWGGRLLAFELVAAHRGSFAALDRARVVRWSKGLGDWGSVDLFGCTLGGQAWRAGKLSDATVMAWTRSADRWRRRLALVCTVPLNSRARGGIGDARRTLAVCARLLDDRDDMVVKALSWALRELAKRDGPAVRRFLVEHGDRLAARVWREVTNKLITGLKNPRGGPPRGSNSSS